nr:PREDICTED: solute carrier family 2, facilitated glucose transporter member 5 isoform X3 [Lepisosteus oculatus]
MAGANILENPDLRKGKLTPVLALATLISAFGSSFQYGYNIAVVNSPAPFMQQFYNRTYSERFGAPIDDSFLTLLWSLTVSMFPLGGFLGSLMVAPLVNKLGRRGTLLFNNIFSVVPAVLMGASEAAESYEIIIAARVFVGICAGLSSNVVPMYLGELSPRNLRGAIGIVPQLFITIGILTAQILGIRSILGNTRGWPLMLALTGVPALLELLCLPFFPESPRYSLIQREDEEEARRDLLLRRQHLQLGRREGQPDTVRHSWNGGGERLHDCGSGVRRGGRGPEAAAPRGFWDLLWGLCRADGGAHPPGNSPVDALSQHCLCSYLCDRACHWTQSHSLRGDDGDIPAVLSPGSIHGGRLGALALQLHRRAAVPLPGERARRVQLHHLLPHLLGDAGLYFHRGAGDQKQNLPGSQPAVRREEQDRHGDGDRRARGQQPETGLRRARIEPRRAQNEQTVNLNPCRLFGVSSVWMMTSALVAGEQY